MPARSSEVRTPPTANPLMRSRQYQVRVPAGEGLGRKYRPWLNVSFPSSPGATPFWVAQVPLHPFSSNWLAGGDPRPLRDLRISVTDRCNFRCGLLHAQGRLRQGLSRTCRTRRC